jgi:hypothetical protein
MQTSAIKGWPRGLKVVFSLIALGLVISVTQVGMGTWSNQVPLVIIYAAASTGLYGAALVAGVMGRRLAFFWTGLAVSFLHLSFCTWYCLFLADFVAKFHRLPRGLTLFWNLCLLALALTLGLYLVVVERPRALPPSKARASQTET